MFWFGGSGGAYRNDTLPWWLCFIEPKSGFYRRIYVKSSAPGWVVEYWMPCCFVKATKFGSEIITPSDLAYVNSSINSTRWGSILWPPGKVSRVVVSQSNLVWVVLKALIDMGLVSVETPCCHMDIPAIEMGGQWGGGDAAESLSSLKGYYAAGWEDQPWTLHCRHTHTSRSLRLHSMPGKEDGSTWQGRNWRSWSVWQSHSCAQSRWWQSEAPAEMRVHSLWS